MNFRDAADGYVSLGWKVIPLQPGSKEPWPGSRGAHEASDDPKQIDTWAARDNASNIGIVAGPSGLMIVDLDPRNDCWRTLDKWAARKWVFPLTVHARTRSGGLHLFFSLPQGLPQGWKRKLPGGVDVQVGWKYVVAAPSVIRADLVKDGVAGSYEWVTAPVHPHLLSPPRWFIDLLKPDPVAPFVGRRAEGSVEARMEGAVRKASQTGKGGRNDELNKQAHLLGRMVAEEGLDYALAESRLIEAARACGLVRDDGLPAARATIRSGLGAGMRALSRG